MNTSKMTPRSLGCFQQVAVVIGEEAAEIELQKVIDYKDAVWVNPKGELADSFGWNATPQGGHFWDNVDDGFIPKGYTPATKDQPEGPPKPAPVFGDVLHIEGSRCVYLSRYGHSSHKLASEDGQVHIVNLEQIDEYTPDPTQELRERILERWKGQSLYHAYDTVESRAGVSVGDIVEFVIENLNAEFGED